MESFLKTRIKKLKNDLELVDKNKHAPTDKATLREQYFRKFIIDLFPHYDAFKGNINGKSCDFVLADKDHPKYNSTPNYYHTVFTSLVDTVIDLKGKVNKPEFNKGWEQSFRVKSKIREAKTRNVPEIFNVGLNYLNSLIIAHGIVFIKGKLDIVLKHLIEKISPSNTEKKYLELNAKNIEYFYKSPDFFYSIEENEIIWLDKTNIFPYSEIKEQYQKKSLRIFKIKGKHALVLFVYLLEIFSNMRDGMKMWTWYQSEFATQFEDFYFRAQIICNLSPEIKWILKEVDPEYSYKVETVNKLTDLLKIKNIKIS